MSDHVTAELARLRSERLEAAQRTGRGMAQASVAMISSGALFTFGASLGIGAGMGMGLLALMTTTIALKNLIHGGAVLMLVARERRVLLAGFPTAIVVRRT